MLRTILILLFASLAGCASPEIGAYRIGQMSTLELCERVGRAGTLRSDSSLMLQELSMRKADCSSLAAERAQRDRERERALNEARETARTLFPERRQPQQQKPPVAPTEIQCVSRRSGDRVYTTCQ